MRLHGKTDNCCDLSTCVAEIAIIPWKVRRNDSYSRVALNKKKRTTKRSERVSFLMQRNE